MQKKFITNLALLLVLNLLIKPFWMLGIDRAVQVAVGSEQYGFYYALFNFSFLLNILLDLGITNFNNKNIAQNNHLLNKHLSSIIVLRLMLAGLYMLITISAGFIVGYNTLQLTFISILGFNQILISFIMYLRSNIAGLHLFKIDSFISVLDRIIMIAICGMLLWGRTSSSEPFKIQWYLYGQTAAYFITALITLVIVIDKAKLKKLNVSKVFFVMIIKKSYPYAILVLLMTFYNRIDTVMLERMLPDGNKQSGIYASAYRLLEAANMIAFLFSGMLLPMFARMIKLKQSVEELVKLAFCLLVIPAIVVAVCSFFYQEQIMALLYKEHIAESASLFGILMCCFVPIASSYIFGTLLTANGNLKQLNIMACSGMVINISLNIFLIPIYFANGAASVSLITQLSMALVQIFMVQKFFKFKINYKFIALVGCFIAGTITLTMLSRYFPFGWMLNFIIAASGSLALAIATKVISIKSIFSVLKQDQ
jgi:O-antigen/teichoic acid export membrane protein